MRDQLSQTAIRPSNLIQLRALARFLESRHPALSIAGEDWAGGFGGLTVTAGGAVVTVAPLSMYDECDTHAMEWQKDWCPCLLVAAGTAEDWEENNGLAESSIVSSPVSGDIAPVIVAGIARHRRF